MKINTGDQVRVLYMSRNSHGTCLSRPVTVEAVTIEAGRTKRITVMLPEAAGADASGHYEVSAHGDYVSIYDAAARLREAADYGYHVGLGALRASEGYPAAAESGARYARLYERFLATVPDAEREAVEAAYAAQVERIAPAGAVR